MSVSFASSYIFFSDQLYFLYNKKRTQIQWVTIWLFSLQDTVKHAHLRVANDSAKLMGEREDK